MTAPAATGLAPVRRVLLNGAVVLVQPTTTHPAVSLYATVEAGSGWDPHDRLGLAALTARVLDRGTASRTAEDLAEALDSRSVSLGVGVTRHLLGITCTCLSADFADMLEIVADIVRHPTFPIDQVERRRTELVTAIRQDHDNPAAVASDTLMALLYPDGHAYGRAVQGTVSSVGGLQREDLVRFHEAHVRPSGLRLVIVGDVETARALDLVERQFGGWSAPPSPRLVPPSPPPARTRRRVDRPMPDKAQADLAYGFTTIRRADPRYHALVVMNNVLGQYGLGGRLGDSIRERQGMAYYVSSAFDASVAEGPLVIRAGVSPAHVERALASIDEEVERLARDGITAKELDASRRYLIGSLPRLLETNSDIAGFLHNAEFFDLGLDYDRRLPALIQAVTRDEVAAAAEAFLSAQRAAVAVAGPLEPAGDPR